MKEKINWKKFILFFVILLPVLLLVDVISDAISGPIKWDEIWAMKNLFFKLLAALVGAYFASTFNNDKKENNA